MTYRFSVWALLICAPVLAATKAACKSPKQIVDTTSGIHAFQMFDDDLSSRRVLKDAYLYVGTFGTGKPRVWHRGNPAFIAHVTEFWSADTELGRSLSWWKRNHPDWILYQCDRQTPAYILGATYVPLNITNPDVIAWQVSLSAKNAQRAGQDGVGADTFSLNNLWAACGVYQQGRWKALFSGKSRDNAWAQAAANWVSAVANALHALPAPLDLWVNFNPAGRAPGDAPTQQVLAALDGDVVEDQFTNTLDGRPTPWKNEAAWQQEIYWMDYAQAHGAAVLGVQNLQELDDQSIEYAISSYLLAKDQAAAIYAAQGQDYRGEHYQPEYNAAVGAPASNIYRSQNVYWRRYGGALVVVNPSDSKTYNVTLPDSSYVDLEGKVISSPVLLKPHIGLTLLPTAVQ